MLISLMESKSKKIVVNNKKRFKEEFGEELDEKPPNLQRPDDYRAIFSGNVDDHFRIGGEEEAVPASDWPSFPSLILIITVLCTRQASPS